MLNEETFDSSEHSRLSEKETRMTLLLFCTNLTNFVAEKFQGEKRKKAEERYFYEKFMISYWKHQQLDCNLTDFIFRYYFSRFFLILKTTDFQKFLDDFVSTSGDFLSLNKVFKLICDNAFSFWVRSFLIIHFGEVSFSPWTDNLQRWLNHLSLLWRGTELEDYIVLINNFASEMKTKVEPSSLDNYELLISFGFSTGLPFPRPNFEYFFPQHSSASLEYDILEGIITSNIRHPLLLDFVSHFEEKWTPLKFSVFVDNSHSLGVNFLQIFSLFVLRINQTNEQNYDLKFNLSRNFKLDKNHSILLTRRSFLDRKIQRAFYIVRMIAEKTSNATFLELWTKKYLWFKEEKNNENKNFLNCFELLQKELGSEDKIVQDLNYLANSKRKIPIARFLHFDIIDLIVQMNNARYDDFFRTKFKDLFAVLPFWNSIMNEKFYQNERLPLPSRVYGDKVRITEYSLRYFLTLVSIFRREFDSVLEHSLFNEEVLLLDSLSLSQNSSYEMSDVLSFTYKASYKVFHCFLVRSFSQIFPANSREFDEIFFDYSRKSHSILLPLLTLLDDSRKMENKMIIRFQFDENYSFPSFFSFIKECSSSKTIQSILIVNELVSEQLFHFLAHFLKVFISESSDLILSLADFSESRLPLDPFIRNSVSNREMGELPFLIFKLILLSVEESSSNFLVKNSSYYHTYLQNEENQSNHSLLGFLESDEKFKELALIYKNVQNLPFNMRKVTFEQIINNF